MSDGRRRRPGRCCAALIAALILAVHGRGAELSLAGPAAPDSAGADFALGPAVGVAHKEVAFVATKPKDLVAAQSGTPLYLASGGGASPQALGAAALLLGGRKVELPGPSPRNPVAARALAEDGGAEPFDCQEGLWNWLTEWAEDKKKWCCAHKLQFCLDRDTPRSTGIERTAPAAQFGKDESFDCTGQQSAWSEGQALWCCSNKNLGCPSSCGTVCDLNGVSATCAARVVWAIAHQFAGQDIQSACSAANDVVRNDCKEVCSGCDLEPICSKSIVESDCKAGDIPSWSEEKKQGCCRVYGIGCSSLFPPYDCGFDLDTFQTAWNQDKKAWCCENQGRGCLPSDVTTTTAPTTAATTVQLATTTRPLDCFVDEPAWATWTEEERHWCCLHHGKGCYRTTTVARPASSTSHVTTGRLTGTHAATKVTSTTRQLEPFTCSRHEESDDWSSAKRAWCCLHKYVACPPKHPHTTTSQPVKTTAAARAATAADPLPTQAPPSAADPHDCNGTDTSAWTPSQASWCCKHRSKGCSTSSPELYDCMDGFIIWRTTWPADKAAWCCRHYGRGCTTTTAAGALASYDCLDNFATWQTSWPPAKADWCCEHFLRGCPSSTQAPSKQEPPYTCESAGGAGPEAWPAQQAAWCCSHRSVGCRGANMRQFNCYEGFQNGRKSWPDAKKKWCCHKAGVGCAEITTPRPYDCSGGREGAAAWSEGKRAWCCLYEKVACWDGQGERHSTTTNALPYDCEAGLYNWKQGWSYEKKEWCCIYGSGLVRNHLQEGLACPTFDGDSLSIETFQRKFKKGLGRRGGVSWEFLKDLLTPSFIGIVMGVGLVAIIRSVLRILPAGPEGNSTAYQLLEVVTGRLRDRESIGDPGEMAELLLE